MTFTGGIKKYICQFFTTGWRSHTAHCTLSHLVDPSREKQKQLEIVFFEKPTFFSKIVRKKRFLKSDTFWKTKIFCFFKGSSDRNDFIIEINVGNSRICNRFWVDLEIHHSSSESFYVGSDLFRHWFQKLNGLGLDYP